MTDVTETSSDSEVELDETEDDREKKRKQKVYNTAKEIMTTEETFCDILVLLNIVSLGFPCQCPCKGGMVY